MEHSSCEERKIIKRFIQTCISNYDTPDTPLRGILNMLFNKFDEQEYTIDQYYNDLLRQILERTAAMNKARTFRESAQVSDELVLLTEMYRRK